MASASVLPDEFEEEVRGEPETKRARRGSASSGDASSSSSLTTGLLRETHLAVRWDAASLDSVVAVAARQLDVMGYAVVPGVFSEMECRRIRAAQWAWVEATTQHRVSRTNPKTWKLGYWVPCTRRIIQHCGVGQSDAAWLARTNLNAVRVFAGVYGDDKLTVSYDGMNLGPAPELTLNDDGKTRAPWPQDGDWMHTDQSPYRKGRRCIQGFGTFEEVDGQCDATLMVIPRSHLTHKDLVTKHGIAPVLGGKQAGKRNTTDWYKFSEDDLAAVEGNNWRARRVRVSAPKGSIVLWDSRTDHQACAPVKGRKIPRQRNIVYLCYQPVKGMTDRQRARKVAAALNNRTTTHYPRKSKLFGPSPRTYGAQLPDFDVQTGGRDDNDPVVQKLCCMTPYGNKGLLGWKKPQAPMLAFEELD